MSTAVRYSNKPQETTEPPESPCIGVCTPDPVDEDHCMGCFRSMDEIEEWSRMTPEEQWAVVRELPSRDPEAAEG